MKEKPKRKKEKNSVKSSGKRWTDKERMQNHHRTIQIRKGNRKRK